MPTGEPVLGSGLGDRQLLGDDFEDGNTSTGHAPRLSAAPRTSTIPAIAAAASPYGLGLRDDRRHQV